MNYKQDAAMLIKSKANDIIYNRIGTSVGTGEPIRDNVEGKIIWRVPIESDYPRIVRDQKNDSLRFTVLHLGQIDEILFDEEANPIKIPHRPSLDNKIHDELSKISERISELLLQTESNKFAKLVSTRHLASPLANIITNVITYTQYQIPSLDTKYGNRILAYSELLKKRKFLIIEGDMISPSGLLQEFYDESNDLELTIETVMTDVIKNEREFMGQFDQLSPLIKVPTTYYDQALSVQSFVTFSKEDLWDVFSQNFGYTARSKFRFADWLRVLTHRDVQILENTDRGYQGDEMVFDHMAEALYDEGMPLGMVL